VFFATCARLIPNDVRVTVEQQLPGNLTPEDWAIIREIVGAVRQPFPIRAPSRPVPSLVMFWRRCGWPRPRRYLLCHRQKAEKSQSNINGLGSQQAPTELVKSALRHRITDIRSAQN
jgi:hypothetical protein